MVKEINGLYFYKLDSGSTWGEDNQTLYQALNISHIDHNFNTLIGNDIESIDFDANIREIVVTRKNGTTLSSTTLSDFLYAQTEGNVQNLILAYDDNKGEIELHWTENGENKTIKIDGLVTEKNISNDFLHRVFTNSTIEGDGTPSNPLGISPLEKTGQIAPCLEILNFKEGETYPYNYSVGSRYLVYDTVNLYGNLYNAKSDIPKITRDLEAEGSFWRVPTVEDFDAIIEALNECDNAPAKQLKSVDKWINNNGDDVYGFCAYPTGYISDTSLRNDKRETHFWTSTALECSTNENYAYYLSSDNNLIIKETNNTDYNLAIRLIKDYDGGNFTNIETILGDDYKCVLVPSKTEHKFTVVIGENLKYNTNNSIVNPSQDALMSTYFVTEYNGKEWLKTPLVNGSTVFITKEEIEYRFIDGILTDVDDSLKTEIGIATNYAINANTQVNTKGTGQYEPCQKLVYTLPSNASVGDRYLLKSFVNLYGRLYNFDGVQTINDKIKNTNWRVPTKDDWEDMINSLPTQKQSLNLKSKDYWNGTNFNKFNILPTGYILVRGSSRLIGNGENAYLWASDESIAYGIATDSNVLAPDVQDNSEFHGVRLCKDYDGFNYTSQEMIGGISYPCTLMPSRNSKSKQKVWTTVNANFTAPSNQMKDLSDFVEEIEQYIICEWNGEDWIRTQFNEGDTIVLYEGLSGEDYMEYMLWHGQLISIVDKYVKNKKPGTPYTLYIGSLPTETITSQSQVETLSSVTNTTRDIDPTMIYCDGGKYIFYCVPSILEEGLEEIEIYANGMLINSVIMKEMFIDGIKYNIYRLSNEYHGRIKIQII